MTIPHRAADGTLAGAPTNSLAEVAAAIHVAETDEAGLQRAPHESGPGEWQRRREAHAACVAEWDRIMRTLGSLRGDLLAGAPGPARGPATLPLGDDQP